MTISCPSDLNELGKQAYEVILRVVTEEMGESPRTEGKTFYSPLEWRLRNESYGTNSELIIVHDGGVFAKFFNLDYGHYELEDKIQNELNKIGLYAQACTSWYTAIYKI
jgi:hypothetical protein